MRTGTLYLFDSIRVLHQVSYSNNISGDGFSDVYYGPNYDQAYGDFFLPMLVFFTNMKPMDFLTGEEHRQR